MKIVITDLDGTLLNDKSLVSELDYKTLEKLSEEKIIRIISTGRSVYSALKVLENDFPIDYFIFSTGAGIIDWKTKEIIMRNCLDEKLTFEIIETLIELKVDFMVHKEIPLNHEFYYYHSDENNIGFNNRIEIYKNYAIPISKISKDFKATQFVVIIPNDIILFDRISKKLNDVNVIRTTSPINDNHIWLEIFPKNVSKGHSALWLINKLEIELKHLVALGNDYNDIDLLEIAGSSFVVENAPTDLKNKYNVVKSNNNCCFSDAIYQAFNALNK